MYRNPLPPDRSEHIFNASKRAKRTASQAAMNTAMIFPYPPGNPEALQETAGKGNRTSQRSRRKVSVPRPRETCFHHRQSKEKAADKSIVCSLLFILSVHRPAGRKQRISGSI